MSVLYPLRFQPILRRYLWGGRRLESLGKTLGEGDDYAESWEIVDRQLEQSLVAYGPLAGQSLAALVQAHAHPLLGRHADLAQFPLLVKFLDARDRLSIQVHPDDARGALLDPPEPGKTEAWVILAREPHSYLYAGLRRGVDRDLLARETARHCAELCAHRVEPKVGDCFFLPAGVLHALGPGLLVAEIQQPSDVTYRLWDWNRRGPDGQARTLHIDEALAAIDFDYGPVEAQQPQPTEQQHVERLVACDKFVIDRLSFSNLETIGGDGRCHIAMVTEGAINVGGDPSEQPLARGHVVLLPADLGPVPVRASGPSVVLDTYLP